MDEWARAWLAPQPRDIAAEEAHEQAQVLGWLEQLGVVARLKTMEECWLLARLVAAGSHEAAGEPVLASPVPPALPSGEAVEPVLTRQVLARRQIFDYTAAFVEPTEPAVRTRRAPSSGPMLRPRSTRTAS